MVCCSARLDYFNSIIVSSGTYELATISLTLILIAITSNIPQDTKHTRQYREERPPGPLLSILLATKALTKILNTSKGNSKASTAFYIYSHVQDHVQADSTQKVTHTSLHILQTLQSTSLARWSKQVLPRQKLRRPAQPRIRIPTTPLPKAKIRIACNTGVCSHHPGPRRALHRKGP